MRIVDLCLLAFDGDRMCSSPSVSRAASCARWWAWEAVTVAASEDVGWNSRPALRFHVAAFQEEVEGEADLLWE